MVADSIRRILPTVMNEILIKTIAGAGVVKESVTKSTGKRKYQKRSRPLAEVATPVRQGPRKLPPKKKVLETLGKLLDQSAGSEFYHQSQNEESEIEEEDIIDEDEQHVTTQDRMANLAPHLRTLAEGMSVIDDDKQMWGADEHDSSSSTSQAEDGPPVDIDSGAKKLGMNFSKMQSIIGPTAKKKVASDDRAAHEQFEKRRLKLMREKLNGGRPVE